MGVSRVVVFYYLLEGGEIESRELDDVIGPAEQGFFLVLKDFLHQRI